MGCSSSANKQAVRVNPAKKSEIRLSESISRSSLLLSNRTEIEHPCEIMFPYFRTIINGIQRIPRSNELDFIACLTSASMPLVTCPTNLEDKEYSHMVLPVAAISVHEKGRVVAFGNFEILTECKQENAEYFSFLENVICYALGPRPRSSVIYFLNIGHQDAALLNHNLTGLGYHVETGNSAQNLSKYGVVVTYSTTRFEDELYQYVVNGGGIIVGCSFDWLPSIAALTPIEDPLPQGKKLSSASSQKSISSTSSVSSATSSATSVNVNSGVFQAEKQLQQLLDESHRANHFCNCWLSRCGLGFPEVHISLPIVQKAALKVSSKVYDLEKSTFPSYINQFIKILQEEKPKLSDLSTITSYLRYNILCNNRCPNLNISKVLDLSMEYLQLTNYEQPDGIFYSEVHVLLAILISDIFEHIDPYDFITRKIDGLFPGEYQPDANLLESVQMDIQIQHMSEWASTGLYLPAGQIATVAITPSRNIDDLNSFYEDLYIQVGSHSESLLSSPGPWKRWPNVVLKFPVKEGPIDIASPFGGLVYVVREPLPTINPDIQQVYNLCLGNRNSGRSKASASPSKNLPQINNAQPKISNMNTSEYKNLSLTIDNVVRSPFYIESQPDSLIMSTAPWGEIRTKNAIITLPSSVLYKIKNLDTFSQCFDKMIKQVELFVGYSTTKPFRLVFDIDQPKLGTTSSYPLMLSFDLLNSLFDIEKPSSDLFAVMMMIGIVCLPENVFGANVEAALGILAAAHVFYVVFNITTPEQFIYEHISPIFAEMWRVYTRNEIKLIPTAMAKFQIHCKTDPFTSSEEAYAFLVNELSKIAEKDFNSLLNEGLHPQQNADQFPEYHPVDEEEPQ